MSQQAELISLEEPSPALPVAHHNRVAQQSHQSAPSSDPILDQPILVLQQPLIPANIHRQETRELQPVSTQPALEFTTKTSGITIVLGPGVDYNKDEVTHSASEVRGTPATAAGLNLADMMEYRFLDELRRSFGGDLTSLPPLRLCGSLQSARFFGLEIMKPFFTIEHRVLYTQHELAAFLNRFLGPINDLTALVGDRYHHRYRFFWWKNTYEPSRPHKGTDRHRKNPFRLRTAFEPLFTGDQWVHNMETLHGKVFALAHQLRLMDASISLTGTSTQRRGSQDSEISQEVEEGVRKVIEDEGNDEEVHSYW
ncbi:MAG: hypothetical protein Q9218_004741 [Villophora microphyllina]